MSIGQVLAGVSVLLVTACAGLPETTASAGGSRAVDGKSGRYSAYDYQAPAYPGPAMGAPSLSGNRQSPPLRARP